MRKTLSDKGVAALKPRAARYAVPDPELVGHYVRVTPNGHKSYCAVTLDPQGKQRWTTIGPADATTIEAARETARTILNRVRAGLPAVEPKGETLGSVLDNWLKRHVDGNELRSRDKIVDLLDRHVSAEFRARDFVAIRRSEIVALLDEIEDDHGAPQADLVLGIIRRAMFWFASRHDSYTPPIIRGMQRTKQRPRERILSDDEIRAVWKIAGESGTYGALIRLLLLLAQRLDKTISIRWDDISPMKWPSNEPPVWTVRTELREKGNIAAVQLPKAALAVLDELPRYADNPYVLAGRKNSHIAYSGNPKRAFDAKLPKGMPPWTLHDLRRTARSLLSRAGVRPDIAERVMGHAIGGVEGIYDRHKYFDEKSEALAKLADLIETIVGDNVKPLTRAGKRR
jgi:integrase